MRHHLTTAMAIAALLFAPPAGAAAGAASQSQATTSELKAAFLYNFAKFTGWPADALAPGQRLSLCVIGDNAVADALEQTIKGRAVEGHELTVAVVKADWPLGRCHLLYVSGLDNKQSAQLLDVLRSVPMLTVGDGRSFAKLGGVAQLILEDDRMRFAINVTAADRARLHVSSRLLTLATIINEESNVRP
jgi:hypothetical protein